MAIIKLIFHLHEVISPMTWLLHYHIILFSVVVYFQIITFVYYALEAGDVSPKGPIPADSLFIYRPDKRFQIWRFIFYMLIHAG